MSIEQQLQSEVDHNLMVLTMLIDLLSGTLDTAVLIVINSPGDEIVEY